MLVTNVHLHVYLEVALCCQDEKVLYKYRNSWKYNYTAFSNYRSILP